MNNASLPFDASAARAWLNRTRRGVMRLFVTHPREAGETYWQHLRFTLVMSARCFYCWAALFVHGVFPFLFTRTGSAQIEKMHDIMKNRVERQEPRETDLAA